MKWNEIKWTVILRWNEEFTHRRSQKRLHYIHTSGMKRSYTHTQRGSCTLMMMNAGDNYVTMWWCKESYRERESRSLFGAFGNNLIWNTRLPTSHSHATSATCFLLQCQVKRSSRFKLEKPASDCKQSYRELVGSAAGTRNEQSCAKKQSIYCIEWHCVHQSWASALRGSRGHLPLAASIILSQELRMAG